MIYLDDNSLVLGAETRTRPGSNRFRVLYLASGPCRDPIERAQIESLGHRLDGALSADYGGCIKALAARSDAPGRRRFLVAAAGWLYYTRSLFNLVPRYGTVHVVHVTGASFWRHCAPVIVLARFFGKRVVLHYRSHLAETELDSARSLPAPFLRQCDRIVVSSEHLRYIFAGYGYQADFIGDVSGAPADPSPVITSVQPRIAVMAPLEKQANLIDVIKAFKLVKQKYPRAEMTIVGDGSQRPFLENLVAAEHIYGVTFSGAKSSHAAIQQLDEADLYLNSSSLASVSASMMSALARGMPIVTTDTGGIAAVIRDRVNGLLVRVNDHVGMADRIIELIETPDLVAALSEQARYTAARYSWEKIRSRWLSFYERLNP
ncbi:MAG: glycosyltransferase [candidate division Zixibacteria bacterium]|nr:glycosyltransferase [candidate division Zixibacteria bacterium]